jgi:magnesium/cobalt transport protein CorA
VSIKALLSRGDGTDEEIDLSGFAGKLASDELLWVDMDGPTDDDLERVEESIGPSSNAVEALRAKLSAPDARVLDGAIEVVVLALLDDDADELELIQILIGTGWAITRHERSIPSLEAYRDRITDQREVGRLTPTEFLTALLDWHVDSLFRAAERLERRVDELDEAALRRDDDLLEAMVALRARIARLRRIHGAQREVFAEVERPGFMVDVDEGDMNDLRYVSERLDRAGEAVANVREMLIGTFDIHMTRTSQRTNDIMRVLTWASVILLPAGVLAGIMGMNFKVPIFENTAVFFVVIGVMLAVAAITLIVARWRRWL